MADTENPPFSRLFVVGDKEITDEEYEEEFSKFGPVQYVKRIKDKKTGEPKGFVYIKMQRTSSAALAVEKMNGEVMPEHTRPLKVIIASSVKTETQSDEEIFAQLSRLFITIPKDYTETDIRNMFEKHGDISKILVVKDRQTGESKGLCYVTFRRAYECALAYEACDREYKPKFADPISRKRQRDDDRDREKVADDRRHDRDRLPLRSPAVAGAAAELLSSYPHQNMHTLKVRVPKGLTEMQLTRLFNLVPSLEYCRHVTNAYSATDMALVKYTSAGSCAYAREAFHGFEYPPGCPLECEYDYESATCYQGSSSASATSQSYWSQTQASGGAGYSGVTNGSPAAALEGYTPHLEMKKRLFVVSQPEKVSPQVLTELFCRYGNFICFNYIIGKNCGFAKFATVDSADRAMRAMNGELVGQNRLKVIEAEDPPESKRSRHNS